MKRLVTLLVPAVLISLSAPALAGEKCTASTQECLDYMVQHYGNRGWLGIEGDYNEAGALVLARVIPDSPAEKGGFLAGDALVAVDGIAYGSENEAALKAVKTRMVPGAEFTFTIRRAGETVALKAVLAKMPEDVLARMIGMHMMEHASAEATRGS